MNPFQTLQQQAAARPQSIAFIFGDEIWTYRRLAGEVDRLASGLNQRRIRRGDRVALHMFNRPEMIVAYYACFQVGAIAAPLRTAFTAAELAPLMRRLQPVLYIGEAALYPNVAGLDESVLKFCDRFIVDAGIDDHRVTSWHALLDDFGIARPSVAPHDHAPAVLINTSGTTGTPKFVVHTAATLAESIRLMGSWDFGENEVGVLPLAMAHVSGLASALFYVAQGAKFVLLRSFDADAVLDAMERHRCTWFIGFPAMMSALLDHQRAWPRNLQSLRFCGTGGDVCPVPLQEQFPKIFGVPLRSFWAATEAVGSLTYGLSIGPVSRVSTGQEFRLVDDAGVDVPRGDTGELLVRGAHVTPGYWNEPAATATTFKDGWYHTGDLMYRGDGDELWFVGRKKDLIIRGGTNISPIEIERVLVASHPSIREAAVVGIPDDVLGQRVFGFVRLADGAKSPAFSDVLAECSTKLARYKVPEGLKIVDEFPRNALSKVDRSRLLSLVPDFHLSPYQMA
ncbi:class I adenylate-forming enzyme family protein [Beijerinckia sp. L45]|uniref:class I adenylate-forming enzyme family protein n=1 Tax=Beijerinckia sp. L45 TaxID=1641855 RepID=UPI00131C6D73|nr:class I adenylate-forming enzyme family protein [Beijerinckia sp. L45]